MMRRNGEVVNEMEFRMSSAGNRLSPQLRAKAMKGFFQFTRRACD
jgi:hypothetical protein